MKGCTLKWPDKSLKLIYIFSMRKIVGRALNFSAKRIFTLNKYEIKKKIWVKILFLLFNLKEIKNVLGAPP